MVLFDSEIKVLLEYLNLRKCIKVQWTLSISTTLYLELSLSGTKCSVP